VDTHSIDPLTQSATRLQAWCINCALPLWENRARKSDHSWVEHLHLDGTADHTAERRWRVLARQVYVYAKADALGWFDGRDIAVSTYEKMIETGFVHRVKHDGAVVNSMRDLYDHAFYVLAASSLYGLTLEKKYLDDADSLLDWIDTTLLHPTGGWRESNQVDNAAPRRQNPHMHLFEASLFLYGITQDRKHLCYAKTVFDLFKSHFFDVDTISEFFNTDWTLESGPKGQTVEPGHAVEWVWLLGEYHKATGQNVREYQAALYGNALYRRGKFLNDEEDKSGEIRRETKRLWVQTEVIKAHLAMAEAGTPGSRDMAAATIDALFQTFLTPAGLWKDQINVCGSNIAQTIPVSTFYHILCMAAESERIAALPR